MAFLDPDVHRLGHEPKSSCSGVLMEPAAVLDQLAMLVQILRKFVAGAETKWPPKIRRRPHAEMGALRPPDVTVRQHHLDPGHCSKRTSEATMNQSAPPRAQKGARWRRALV
jgi:hypothetical protein